MITLTSSQRASLVTVACAEIEGFHNRAVHDITTHRLSRTQYEAQFVARLCVAASGIATSWRALLRVIAPARTLNLASVFTHQTPYVKWLAGATTPRCELADLLIAVIDKNARYGRAMLIQAKQSDTGSVKLTTPSEKKQFDLLSGRPKFHVDGALAPSNIDLSAEIPDDSLQYGLNPPDSPLTSTSPLAWPQHRWTMTDGLGKLSGTYAVTSKDCLAEWMVELLEGTRGWRFDLPAVDWQDFNTGKQSDSWPALVNYLLEVTFSKPLKQLTFGGPAATRGTEESMLFLSNGPSPRMFAITQSDGSDPAQGDQELGDVSDGSWQSVPGIFWSDVFDGGDNNGPQEPEPPEPPPSGPISAIVFELGSREEDVKR